MKPLSMWSMTYSWFQYLVLPRSLFVGWFSILSHFSNKIYLSALRVTACLFSVEIIPIDTKKRKMPESLVFTSGVSRAGSGVGRLGHTGGRNDETSLAGFLTRNSKPQPEPVFTLYGIQGVNIKNFKLFSNILQKAWELTWKPVGRRSAFCNYLI